MDIQLTPIVTRLQTMLEGTIAAIPNLVIGLIVFGLFVFIARLVGNAVDALALRTGQPRGIALVFGRIAAWTVLTLGLLVSLTVIIPTLTAASLFGALGVSGVAIGFAFKDIFQNLLAGILILITRPFRLGDQIVSGDNEGTVEDIQVRATMLRTYDNRRVVIPNAELYTNRVTVNTAHDKRRLAVPIGIGYGDDIAEAKALILREISELEVVLADPPPQVFVVGLGDSAVNLEVRFWIDPPVRREVVEAQDAVLELLKRVLPEHGIDLPFPTSHLLFHDQTEQTDGQRSRQREGWPSRGPDRDPPPARAALAQAPGSGAAPSGEAS